MPTPSPATVSADTIRRALGELQIAVNDSQVLQIQQYMSILLTWNERINLTAIRDPLEILNRHFCECMYAASTVPAEDGRLADVGSGAGFPVCRLNHPSRAAGSPYRIECQKATFLAEVIRDLGLAGARVLVSRYEELTEEVAPLDFVCSRALGKLYPFWSGRIRKRLQRNRLSSGLGPGPAGNRKSTDLEWREPIPVPHSLRRVLLVGTRRSSPRAHRLDLGCNSSNRELSGPRIVPRETFAALFHVERP